MELTLNMAETFFKVLVDASLFVKVYSEAMLDAVPYPANALPLLVIAAFNGVDELNKAQWIDFANYLCWMTAFY